MPPAGEPSVDAPLGAGAANMPLCIAVRVETYTPPHWAFDFMKPTTVSVHVLVVAPLCRKNGTRTWNGWKVVSVGLMPTMSAGPLVLASGLDALRIKQPVWSRAGAPAARLDAS